MVNNLENSKLLLLEQMCRKTNKQMKNKRVCIYENHKFESWIKRIEMKVTISVMKTTWAEVKMKPEKKKKATCSLSSGAF